MTPIFDVLAAIADLADSAGLVAILLLARVGAIAAMLPGFGEAFLSIRSRLAVAIALSVIVYPAAAPSYSVPTGAGPSLMLMLLSEAMIGLLLGLGVRLVVMALQFAGSIAAQSTSIAQIAGAGVAPDPMPAMGNLLLMGGLTLALVLGVHVRAVASILETYRLLPPGAVITGAQVYVWGVDHAMAAFDLAFTLAAPFVLTALVYNVSLGVINRAMPQLMVAFVGAPAITGLTILILLFAIGAMLTVWFQALDAYLLAPLEIR